MLASRAPRTRVGDVIGGAYRLDELLATGGMGAVYRGVQLDLVDLCTRPVAVKVLSSTLLVDDELVTRFLREARALDAARHPNVVTVLDAGRDRTGAPFVVQELLDGMDLAEWLARKGGRVSPKAAVAVLLPIARALVHAHAAGVVHRDVKPENVFLARDGAGRVVPKLVDFGISRFVADETARAPRLTGTSVLGTPAYMSPEQVRATRDVDGRTDVWSLGVVLYELVSGRLPFDGGDSCQLIAAIATKDPRRLEDEVVGDPDVGVAVVADVVRACLVRDRDARLTAAQLVEALERAREELAQLPD